MDSLADYNKLRHFLRSRIATLLSGTFAIDSTGLRTLTVAHGLYFAPTIQEISLTVTEDTNVDDWAYNLLKVESVDNTNVVAKINVSSASGTGGATAKLGILIVSLGAVSGATLATDPSSQSIQGWFEQPSTPIRRKPGTREGASVIAPSQLP